jgi:dipeptidyl aminopeptidase/acylaminoacyl peptidase
MVATKPQPTFERFAQLWAQSDLAFTRPGELVYVANTTGQYNLWKQAVGPRGEPGFQTALTAFRDRTIRLFEPSRDGRTLFFAADQDGDEQYQIFRLDSRGGDPVPVTENRKVRHDLTRGSLDARGRRLLYCDNERSPTDMDVVVHDLTTNQVRRPLPEGFLWADPRWDPSSERFTALQFLSNTQIRAFVHDVRRATTSEVLPHETEEAVMTMGWTADGRRLVVLDDLGSEYRRLELVDWRSGNRRTLASPRADVEFARYSPRGDRLVYGVNEDGFTTLWSGRLTGPFRAIRGIPPGHTVAVFDTLVTLAPDGRSMVLAWSTGAQPTELLWVPLEGGRPTYVTQNMPGGVPDAPLPPPRLVRFASFDGRKIPALYYRPKHRPHGKAPAILSIHGGPESQERPGWMYYGLYAYLNACGIYVLAPNIRGSTGYGKSYQTLIHHDWGGAELKDLRAAAEWLRSRPEVDPDRLGVFGGSFGGFATLSCMTRLPEFWKVGVDIFGPSNLITFAKTVPPFWLRFMKKWVGDVETEADFLRERSPITYIDGVRADLLIIQGANDPRVNKAESDQMVERLRALGRNVEYMVFPDEGHGFTRTENLLKAVGASARFLVERLGAAPAPASRAPLPLVGL